jgi:signal transduction histidine kinase
MWNPGGPGLAAHVPVALGPPAEPARSASVHRRPRGGPIAALFDRIAGRPPRLLEKRFGPAWRDAPETLFVLRPAPGGFLVEAANRAFDASLVEAGGRAAGRRLEEALHPVIAGALARRCRECVAAAAPKTFLQMLPLRSGRRLWTITLLPVFDEAGAVTALVGQAREAAIGPSSSGVAELPATGEAAGPTIGFTATPEGQVDHVSPSFFTYTGASPEVGVAQALESVHPEDLDALTADGPDLENGLERTARVRGRDGRYRRFRVRAELFDGPAGRRWYGAATELADLRVASQAVRSGEHLFKVIESLDGCCVTLDRDWRLTAVTPGAAAWLSLTPEQLVGLDGRRDLALPPPLVETIEAALASGAPTRVVFPAVLHPGRWGESQVFPFADGVNIVFWEVTAQQLGAAAPEPQDAAANPLAGVGGCLVAVDRNWRMLGISPLAAAWLRRTPGELVGRDLRAEWPVSEALADLVERALRHGESATFEQASRVQPGRWVEFRIHPFPEGVYLLFSDVTERRRAEEGVQTTLQLLQGLSEAVSGEMALLDDRGTVISVNAAWRAAMEGLEMEGLEETLGMAYADLCVRLAGGADEAAVRRGLDQVFAGASPSFTHVSAVPAAGGLRWREFRVTPLAVGTARHFIAVHQDLTGVARMQDELNKTAEQVMGAQEEERQRIAVELHDSTSQHLIALGMGVTRLKRLMGQRKGAQDVLQDMALSVQEAIREIRVLSYLMKPADLQRNGLRATAERFVTGFGARTGLAAAFRAGDGVDEASEEVQHACFRIIQESLANIYRHADARHARVEITSQAGELVVRIADDGKGIGSTDLSEKGPVALGVGIPGMRARAAQLGGRVEITGRRGGTVVVATLPLQGGEARLQPSR